nr:DNA polymerase ligase N-terminal domain-containing protein [Candidatus Njordarchaeota archaeon]
MRFTLHEHKAKKAGLHYDLRLELQGGEVRSFAMRYQPPTTLGVKRMAIEQPLHDEESLDFEGTIEEGYGAGELKKIDSGEYQAVKETPKELILQFKGSMLTDSYVMLNTGGNKWLIFKKKTS